MKIISIFACFFLICSCNNQTTYDYEQESAKSKTIIDDGIKMAYQQNKYMDARAKIVSQEKKTNSNFEEYYEIVVENVSAKEISDLQISYFATSDGNFSVLDKPRIFSASVNLKPGKKTTIKTLSAPYVSFPEINKIRYIDGDVAVRSN